MAQAPVVYGLFSALAAALFVAAASLYINRASGLTRFIWERYPELWDKVLRRTLAMSLNPVWTPLKAADKGHRLEQIVLFNRAASDYPDDPQFRVLLSAVRQAAFLCLFTFLLALIFFGLATRP